MNFFPSAGWCLASPAALGGAPGFYWNAVSAPVKIIVSGYRPPVWQLAGGVAPQPVAPRYGACKSVVAPPVTS